MICSFLRTGCYFFKGSGWKTSKRGGKIFPTQREGSESKEHFERSMKSLLKYLRGSRGLRLRTGTKFLSNI